MKRKIFVILCVVMFFNIFLGSTKKNLDFNVYNDFIEINSNIIEEGFKIQFTDSSFDKNIKNKLDKKGYLYKDDENFHFEMKESNYKLEIKFINSFVEIEITFLNSINNVEFIESKLKEYFKNKKDLKVFTYVKGKLNDSHSLDEEKLNSIFKDLELLDIENGQTGTFSIKGEQYNIAIMNYGKDNSYLIVGSPVIFISY